MLTHSFRYIVSMVLFFCITTTTLLAQHANISLKIKKQPIAGILTEIEKNYHYRFAYSMDKIDLTKTKSLTIKNGTIEQTLNQLFYNTNIAYQISGTNVALFINPNATFTISGYIREAGTGELLIGALIDTKPNKVVTTSNAYGFFSITLPTDTYEISFSYLGFKNQLKKLVLDENIQLTVLLNASSNLSEVLIKGSQNNYQRTLNKVEIPLKEVADIPMILGEKDPVKYLMLMPGIQKGSEGNSYMYVRGGGPDQNLILIDDAVIYNAYHFLGLSSLVSGSELRSAELIKGGFSSKYGGRLSSVLNMSLKDGNREKFGGEASMGILASKIILEGPIVKNKSSFMFSGRRSYIDQISKVLDNVNGELNYYFYDVHGKIATDLNKKNRLIISGYAGYDNFSTTTDNPTGEGITWGNYAASIRWTRQYNTKLFSNTSLTYSNYSNKINMGAIGFNSEQTISTIRSSVIDKGLKIDFDYIPNPKHHIKFGGGYTQHELNPTTTIEDLTNRTTVKNGTPYFADDASMYIESQTQITNKWTIIPGIRFSYFKTNTGYFRAEPRFNTIYQLPRNWNINGSYSLMNQYMHLVPLLSNFGLPSDLWVGSNNDIKPQRGHIITAGVLKKSIKNRPFSFGIEGYYKIITDVTAMKEGASLFQLLALNANGPQVSNVSDLLTQGKSKAYGIEFVVKKESKKLSAQLSYTISKTEMEFTTINRGEKFAASYDRLNDLGIFVSYKTNKHFSFALTWIYGTGSPITLPVSEFIPVSGIPGQGAFPVYYYDSKNNVQLKAYHRLDVSFQYTHTIAKTIISNIELSLFNTYNRRNPLYYRIEYVDDGNGNGKRVLKQTSLFPIIPSLSWTLKF